MCSETFSNHGTDCDRLTRIEGLINRRALFGFEGDLASAIGGTVFGGFCVELDFSIQFNTI